MPKLLLLFILTGCAFFIEKIDTSLVDEKDYLKNIPETPTYCPLTEKPTLQLVGSNIQSQNVYQDFTRDKGRLNLDPLDHFALWTLIQLAIRPDQSSLTSRFQALFLMGNKTQYLDFFSEFPRDQFPLLYGIEWVLKKYGKKQKLEHYASILDKDFPNRLRAGKSLENFLMSNVDKIKENPTLAPFFIRGAEVLKENERVPRFSYREMVRYYRAREKKQKIIVNTSLTDFVTESGQRGSCNYDFNLYDNSIFLIDKVIPVANLFGLMEKDFSFLASTSQKIESISSINGFPLFLGESKVRSSAVCVIEDQDNHIWTFSNLSRDPGQHLFHLIRYGLANSRSTMEVDKLIRHSRHLFLSDPVRLIIESNRSRPDQIENLLKLNLPIYNGEKLGNIWAYTLFNSQGRFIIDDRNVGAFSCR